MKVFSSKITGLALGFSLLLPAGLAYADSCSDNYDTGMASCASIGGSGITGSIKRAGCRALVVAAYLGCTQSDLQP